MWAELEVGKSRAGKERNSGVSLGNRLKSEARMTQNFQQVQPRVSRVALTSPYLNNRLKEAF